MRQRITVTDLREHLKTFNKLFAENGSNLFLREQGRNGYQAVDVYFIDAGGKEHCQRMLQGGTARECMCEAREFYLTYRGQLSYATPRRTRAMAKAVLARHIDFSKDFHALGLGQVEGLACWAKLTGYRKPQNANGSTARYFHAHLVNKVKL